MNPTHKRLEIIKLAISLTDEECINQQRYKLASIRSDDALEEILRLLEEKNYAQAQSQIIRYLNTQTDTPNAPNLSTQSHTKDDSIDYQAIDSVFQTHTAPDHAPPSQNTTPPHASGSQTTHAAHHSTPELPIKDRYYGMIKRYAPHLSVLEADDPAMPLLERFEALKPQEEEIYENYTLIQSLKSQGDFETATRYLLAIGATKLPLAQLLIARELLKGELLQKDENEAFESIFHLCSHEEHPEAMCDLAQLYEHGIGVEKNLDEALRLYQLAASLGLERAQRHLQKLQNSPKKLFKLF